MSITSISQVRVGSVTIVTAISGLSGTVYFHWYLDGVHVSSTQSNRHSIYMDNGDSGRVDVLDTTDPDFDPIANAPAGWPARRTLQWHRSAATDMDHYRVEQDIDGGGFAAIGTVHHDPLQWVYTFLTPRLVDLAVYTWRIVPVDTSGNDGAATTIRTEKIVRTPDAPDFTVAWDEGTTKVTWTEAAA